MVESVNGIPAACAARQAENLAVAVHHPAEPDGRKRQRERDSLAENGGGEVALRDVDEHALTQLDVLEVFAVGA